MAVSGTGPVKGRQMGWLRHVLTVLSVLIFVSSQKERQTQALSQIGWLRHVLTVFSVLIIVSSQTK